MSQAPRGKTGPRELLARRGVLPLVGAAAVAIAVIAVIVIVASGGGGGNDSPQVQTRPPGESAGLKGTQPAGPSPTPEATIDLSRPTAVATIDPNAVKPGAAGDRMVIQKFGIEAPLSYKVVGLDGVMPALPTGPDDVAYYDFSNWPGKGGVPGVGGNTVFSGHVDSGRVACRNGTVPPPCTAIFWDLHQLKVGDQISVQLGTKTLNYKVTSNQAVSSTSGDWDTIVTSTAQETITIITCGGDFNQVTHEYNARQVVTAVRI